MIYYIHIRNLICIGEHNTFYNTDKYACSFSKMIYYWRQIWNQRSHGITDIQFPFGFVQVSLNQKYRQYIHTYTNEQSSFYL